MKVFKPFCLTNFMSAKKIRPNAVEKAKYGDFLIRAESYTSFAKDKVRLIYNKDNKNLEVVIDVDPLNKVTDDSFNTALFNQLQSGYVYKIFNENRMDFLNEINSSLAKLRKRDHYPHYWRIRDFKNIKQNSSLD